MTSSRRNSSSSGSGTRERNFSKPITVLTVCLALVAFLGVAVCLGRWLWATHTAMDIHADPRFALPSYSYTG